MAKADTSTKQTRTFRGPEVEAIVTEIHRRLRAGRYSPGHRLVESDLMADLKVSRSAVREALRRLQTEDLVEIEPYRGATVRSLTRDDIRDLLEVLEPLAVTYASLAARKIDNDNNRQRAEESLQATRDFRAKSHTAGNLLDYVQENQRFHEVLRDISGNRKLAQISAQLELQLSRIWFQMMLSEPDRDSWSEGHESILEAVVAGDPERAEREMRSYAKSIRDLLLSLPDAGFGK